MKPQALLKNDDRLFVMMTLTARVASLCVRDGPGRAFLAEEETTGHNPFLTKAVCTRGRADWGAVLNG